MVNVIFKQSSLVKELRQKIAIGDCTFNIGVLGFFNAYALQFWFKDSVLWTRR